MYEADCKVLYRYVTEVNYEMQSNVYSVLRILYIEYVLLEEKNG